MQGFNIALMLVTVLVAISIVSTRLSYRAGAPILLVVLFVGLLAGLMLTYCNALIEAMAASRPVVATDVGGNGEAVVEGVTGRLVPARDAGRLAEATLAVLRRPD